MALDAQALETHFVRGHGVTTDGNRTVVIHTAFIGDVILTLPLLQRLAETAETSAVVIPEAANIVESHPAVHEVIVYDKRGRDRGVRGFFRIVRELRLRKFSSAIIPHRSLRSAALAFFARIPSRVGFDTSSGRWFLTGQIRYDEHQHEVNRNLSLLPGPGGAPAAFMLPRVWPEKSDEKTVDDFFRTAGLDPKNSASAFIALAPGSVWLTKRWPEEKFAELARMLVGRGYQVILVGGKEDAPLCGRIRIAGGSQHILDASGGFTLRQSAALIARTRLLISNDSAPMHLAVAVGTPVVAIFGATVPEFGFGPLGPEDQVVETPGLACRPCGIHGGTVCPISTFDCMQRIEPDDLLRAAEKILSASAEAKIEKKKDA